MPHARPFVRSLGLAALGPALMVQAAPLGAQQAVSAHAALDKLVADFTGAALGTPGGARAPVDRRLRLRACASAPVAQWHGEPGRTVRLVCEEPGGWRLFVGLIAAQSPAGRVASVKRGDTLTVAVIGRGFAVRRSGEAMEAGAVGDWIAVRTGANTDPVRARIVQPGLAEIPLP